MLNYSNNICSIELPFRAPFANQLQMAELFATSKQNVGHHIANVLKDKELIEDSVVKNYLTTASDGR